MLTLIRRRWYTMTVLSTKERCQLFQQHLSALIAYNFKDKKPSLKNNFVNTKQLYLSL